MLRSIQNNIYTYHPTRPNPYKQTYDKEKTPKQNTGGVESFRVKKNFLLILPVKKTVVDAQSSPVSDKTFSFHPFVSVSDRFTGNAFRVSSLIMLRVQDMVRSTESRHLSTRCPLGVPCRRFRHPASET